jgi:hypothetical protein
MAASRQLLPSTVRDLTTARYSPTQNTGYSVGARVDIHITTLTATKNQVFTLEGYNRTADTWVTLLASAATTAVGDVVLQVDPRIASATNVAAGAILPSQVRLKASGTDTLSEFSAHLTLTD